MLESSVYGVFFHNFTVYLQVDRYKTERLPDETVYMHLHLCKSSKFTSELLTMQNYSCNVLISNNRRHNTKDQLEIHYLANEYAVSLFIKTGWDSSVVFNFIYYLFSD